MVNGFKPETLREALEIRANHKVIPYGGGTDLMIDGKAEHPYLFLGKLPELKAIYEDNGYIKIGASASFTQVLDSELIPEIMKAAVAEIAAPAIRNAGTMAGNIGNGSAKADSVLIEYVTDAKLKLESINGTRIVDIQDFYLGRKKLDLQETELITEIWMPSKGLENYYYKKVGARRALAISRVSMAGILDIQGNRIQHFAVGFGAISDTVLRFKDLEQMIVGKEIAEIKETKASIIKAYGERINPTKGRVSSEYRKKVCLNLLNDFFESKGI